MYWLEIIFERTHLVEILSAANFLLPLISCEILGKRCKICDSWWWEEAMPRVPGFCNNGHRWMPISLPGYTRILWRFKYESGTAGSTTFGWETSPKWGHGRWKKCKALVWYLRKLCLWYIVICSTSSFLFFDSFCCRAGASSPSWNQRSLPFWRTDCQYCKTYHSPSNVDSVLS